MGPTPTRVGRHGAFVPLSLEYPPDKDAARAVCLRRRRRRRTRYRLRSHRPNHVAGVEGVSRDTAVHSIVRSGWPAVRAGLGRRLA